jgi:hypothetical protein
MTVRRLFSITFGNTVSAGGKLLFESIIEWFTEIRWSRILGRKKTFWRVCDVLARRGLLVKVVEVVHVRLTRYRLVSDLQTRSE